MDAKQYQIEAARTLIDEPGFEITGDQMMALWCAIGLAGESGEVIDHLKKGILHRHGLDDAKLKEEIGDVCWYIAGLCSVFGFDLGEIMQANIDKLIRRYPDGFNSSDSQRRVDQLSFEIGE